MRMRHKKHGEERILACSEFLIPTPETNEFGRSIMTDKPAIVPSEIFGNDLDIAPCIIFQTNFRTCRLRIDYKVLEFYEINYKRKQEC